MEQQLYELLRRSTVRVSTPGKAGHGTGFFVAPGLIITCAHVVRDVQLGSHQAEVHWNSQRYSAQLTKYLSDTDLALLHVNLADHPCVFLDEEVLPFDNLYSYGYPDDHANGDPATFTLEGKAGEQGEQLKFKIGQVRPGLSGAPILNIRTGYVCGIVQLTRDRASDLGGRAISTNTIFRMFPEVIVLQQLFHRQDNRWMRCLLERIVQPTSHADYPRTIQHKYADLTAIGKELISKLIKGEYNEVFVGSYQPLQKFYIPPQAVFERIKVDRFVGRRWLLEQVVSRPV